jgi:hypothetical protein
MSGRDSNGVQSDGTAAGAAIEPAAAPQGRAAMPGQPAAAHDRPAVLPLPPAVGLLRCAGPPKGCAACERPFACRTGCLPPRPLLYVYPDGPKGRGAEAYREGATTGNTGDWELHRGDCARPPALLNPHKGKPAWTTHREPPGAHPKEQRTPLSGTLCTKSAQRMLSA